MIVHLVLVVIQLVKVMDVLEILLDEIIITVSELIHKMAHKMIEMLLDMPFVYELLDFGIVVDFFLVLKFMVRNNYSISVLFTFKSEINTKLTFKAVVVSKLKKYDNFEVLYNCIMFLE